MTLLQQWQQALREGLYSHTQYRLRDGESFCALGMLCDLAQQHEPGRYYWQQDAFWDREEDIEFLVAVPDNIWQQTGLRCAPGRISVANDLGWSGDIIADLLERLR